MNSIFEQMEELRLLAALSRLVDQESSVHLAFAPGRYAVISVEDSGCGMDEATQENVFEPFFTTKPEGRGTGLGLSTVHGIVRQNEGFVEVASRIGEGTTFNIYLPAAALVGEVAREREPVERERAGTEAVLVVEDEPSLLKLAARMLRGLGYRVEIAGSPQEALALCRENPLTFDLLLTDVVMPGMSGGELYEALSRLYPDLRCLFMSGYTSDALANRNGLLDDRLHFLQKPFTRRQLAEKVRDVLK